MRTIARLVVGWFFVLVAYGMWENTMSPYWAGADAWNLFAAGFFWLVVALSAYDMLGTVRDFWVAQRARRFTSD
jgi:hypothetical protein